MDFDPNTLYHYLEQFLARQLAKCASERLEIKSDRYIHFIEYEQYHYIWSKISLP